MNAAPAPSSKSANAVTENMSLLHSLFNNPLEGYGTDSNESTESDDETGTVTAATSDSDNNAISTCSRRSSKKTNKRGGAWQGS